MQAAARLYDGFDRLIGDDDGCWQVVCRRDARGDGLVYYAVASTGIYCRPTCPARRPRRENVAFYASCDAAEAAGYRPCKRCRPRMAARPRCAAGLAVRPAAIVFVDIKGFTRLAAAMPPDDVLALLGDFHTRLGAVVAAAGGIVHKHLGDGLMAVFGAAVSRPGDAGRAIAAGLAMIDALARWNAARAAAGDPVVAAGIGINFGMVAFGDTAGGEVVIGDAVNVASRLEALTRRLGVELAISDDALRAVAPARARGFGDRLRRVGAVRLPGCAPRIVWANLPLPAARGRFAGAERPSAGVPIVSTAYNRVDAVG